MSLDLRCGLDLGSRNRSYRRNSAGNSQRTFSSTDSREDLIARRPRHLQPVQRIERTAEQRDRFERGCFPGIVLADQQIEAAQLRQVQVLQPPQGMDRQFVNMVFHRPNSRSDRKKIHFRFPAFPQRPIVHADLMRSQGLAGANPLLIRIPLYRRRRRLRFNSFSPPALRLVLVLALALYADAVIVLHGDPLFLREAFEVETALLVARVLRPQKPGPIPKRNLDSIKCPRNP